MLAERNGTSLCVESLKEIYKKLRPGEPPLVDSAKMLINNTFFDPKRYDLAQVGRYKFDKKVALGVRIKGFRLADTVVSPLTGEVIAEAGELVTPELAVAIENNAVNAVTVTSDLDESRRPVRVFSNGTVDPNAILGYDLTD